MKIKIVLLFLFAIVLFIFSWYSAEWSKEFVNPVCDGMHGQCPPSFWECTTVGSMSSIQIAIGVGLLILGVIELFDRNDK